MLETFNLLRNTGTFDSVDSGGQLPLQKVALIRLILFVPLLFGLSACHSKAHEYSVTAIDRESLVANLYVPDIAGRLPVVIAVGGSEGGLSTGDAYGELIAPLGIAVLGLAYFNEEGLPETLDQIPLEYFVSAIEYLESVSTVDPSRIGIVGGSRGAELALLLASHDPRIKSVVALAPSKVAWYGITTAKSAWTIDGIDVPALSLELDESAPLVQRFEAALEDREKMQSAMFAFERINGPILLISARNDDVWPSYQMSLDIEAYLEGKSFDHAVTHVTYPTGHGFSQETAPEIRQLVIEQFVTTL